MKITFDPEVDSMYIKLSVNKPVKQQILNDELTADLDEEGNIVGFEIIDATATYGKGLINLDFALLGDLPQQQRYEYSAEEAADILRINKETVLRKIRSGSLKAKKLGRGYKISKNDIDRYLTSL